MLIDAGHEQYAGLDPSAWEASLAHVAWHEWAHALSLARATEDDVASGRALLNAAPEGVAEFIRGGGDGARQYTHELVAETFVLLMSRRRRGQTGQPPWLADEIYELVRRVVGWSP